MSAVMSIDKMLADIKKHTPKEGFNVVGMDEFEPAGEQLYLIGSFGDRKAADAALERHKAAHPHDPVYVYGAKGAD